MTITGAIVMFVIFWWLVFLATLPIGVRGQFEDEEGVVPGTEAGAPVRPMLGKKAIWATIGSTILTAGLAVASRFFDFWDTFLVG